MVQYSRIFLAVKERQFAKRLVKRLLKSHSAVSAEKPGLSRKAHYREVLLHTKQVDPSCVDQILQQAEDSVDEWTAPARDGLRFRELVHFFVVSQYLASGNVGTVVSFRKIVDALIPADL